MREIKPQAAQFTAINHNKVPCRNGTKVDSIDDTSSLIGCRQTNDLCSETTQDTYLKVILKKQSQNQSLNEIR